MFKNYLQVAFRNFWRNKFFSLVNIIGLTIGISASLIIFLMAMYELGYNKFFKDGDRVHRVVSTFNTVAGSFHRTSIATPIADIIKTQATGLDGVTDFMVWEQDVKVGIPGESAEPKAFKKQRDIIFADEHYFNMFPYHWIAGSPKASIQQPHQVVLTESRARLYFPGLSPAEVVGKDILFEDTMRTTVAGIVKDLPNNTDLSFKTFIAKSMLDTWNKDELGWQLFIKHAPNTSAARVQEQIVQLYTRHSPDAQSPDKLVYELQPLNDLHFNANYPPFNNRLGHRPTLYGLLAVAVILLVLGCINFINLTTAQGAKRAKEIGIRKTAGSSRSQLVWQFLTETFLLTAIAALLSFGLLPVLMHLFRDFIPDGLGFGAVLSPAFLLFFFALIIIVSVLAGFYPALILSGYAPAIALKKPGYARTGKTSGLWLRRTLTIGQFVVSQIFIIVTILASKQIKYTLNKDLGFNKDAIVYFETNFRDTSDTRRALLADQLKSIPEVSMVSRSSEPLTSLRTSSSMLIYRDQNKEIERMVQLKLGDTNYIKLYGLKLLAGENLRTGESVEQVLINSTYARALGFKNDQDAIGKFIDWEGKNSRITGVVADFHQRSLHAPIEPLAIAHIPGDERMFNVALRAQSAGGISWEAALRKIETVFRNAYPDTDFEYSFLDDTIANYYRSERDTSRLLSWATGLAILISCLGLLGLVIYVTNQRTKEIGVRKVLGASRVQIISMLSKDMLRSVLIAFILAVPVAWYAINKWLENFAYHTQVSWLVFAAGGLIMFLIAMSILVLRSFKAASVNPVRSLRTE